MSYSTCNFVKSTGKLKLSYTARCELRREVHVFGEGSGEIQRGEGRHRLRKEVRLPNEKRDGLRARSYHGQAIVRRCPSHPTCNCRQRSPRDAFSCRLLRCFMQMSAYDDTEIFYHPTQDVIHPTTCRSAFSTICIGHFQFKENTQ